MRAIQVTARVIQTRLSTQIASRPFPVPCLIVRRASPANQRFTATQTAVVVGKSGEEIWTDNYGRVKVQFFWDRQGRYDENSSCWIRVAQGWAGKQWGMIHIPRIGQEVVVNFLEGDPDRPIITGSVYNADHMTPYPLPAEQTKSATKSLSSKGGGGFNEIRFEDRKGSEQVFLHGEKDIDIRVKNDRREWIGRDRHLIVARDKLEQIKRDTSHRSRARSKLKRSVATTTWRSPGRPRSRSAAPTR